MKFRIFMLLIIIFGIFDVKDADAFIFGKAMRTDTTVFHNISSTYLKGKSVFIKKYNSDNQMSGTLEFQNYGFCKLKVLKNSRFFSIYMSFLLSDLANLLTTINC